jgi:hypothetical protein
MRIENWELRIDQIRIFFNLINSQFLRLRAIALALRVPILNSHPTEQG